MTKSSSPNSSGKEETVGYGGMTIHVGDMVEDVREETRGKMLAVNMLGTIVGVMKDHNVTYLPAKWFRKVS